jgi:phenylpyruvate tautomerase PptA (4-oxalocrotonate tautomerase family)
MPVATIYTLTARDMEEQKQRELVHELIRSINEVFTKALSFYFTKTAPLDCIGASRDQVLFIVCVPPYIPLEKKRLTIEAFHRAVVRVLGSGSSSRVLFQYHDDEGVGKDGELFADIKAKQPPHG